MHAISLNNPLISVAQPRLWFSSSSIGSALSSALSALQHRHKVEGDRPESPPRPQLSLVEIHAPSIAGTSLPKESDRTLFGIMALLGSTVLFPLSDMLAKMLAASYSGIEVAWMRYLVLMVAVAPLVVRSPKVLVTPKPGVQVARGLSSVCATALALIGFAFLPVADATAISFVTPLLVTGMAVVLLREKVGMSRWAAAVVGFGGTLIIVQPGSGAFQAATLLPLISSLFSAGTVIATRMGERERIETTLVYSAIIGFVVLSAAVAWTWRTPDVQGMELAVVMGALAVAATAMQIAAYRCAPSSLLAPFSYVQLIWATGFGWLLFGTVPGSSMVLGSAVIVASGLFVALREGKAFKGPRGRWAFIRSKLLPIAA